MAVLWHKSHIRNLQKVAAARKNHAKNSMYIYIHILWKVSACLKFLLDVDVLVQLQIRVWRIVNFPT